MSISALEITVLSTNFTLGKYCILSCINFRLDFGDGVERIEEEITEETITTTTTTKRKKKKRRAVSSSRAQVIFYTG